ncbi:MAG: bifunctional precorrin-2 dehydrogenase/sirohydrochlorin ferrochelatase [Candidatus Omnitrophica bacterium]|nr:bifunctional precorrin-2 dehydrogenase/sirohydrochlorin ferrochelatase [Candidatus Omnitrophota bacterium]
MAYYPVFLELKGRLCLVVGGGEVAYRKAHSLAGCGAKVEVVAPKLHPGLRRLAERKKIRWVRGLFRQAHLKGADLVIAATDEARVNTAASAWARKRGLWINVVDRPSLCSFIVPSVVRRGKLVFAVSTGGASPALAKWIRRDLQARYGPEFKGLLAAIAKVRGKVQRRVLGLRQRKKLFEEALAAYFRVIQNNADRGSRIKP